MTHDHYAIDCHAGDEGEACIMVCRCGYHAVAHSWTDAGRRLDVHITAQPSFLRITAARGVR